MALWHMDGHHKLVSGDFNFNAITFWWGFVTHAAIDGYSRKIMYLRCSTNNKADTVLRAFLEAVENFGLPSRIRADQGVENEDVARFMFHHPLRGPDRGSFTSGKGVRNQRIERLCRDLYVGVIYIYYEAFRYFEEQGLLQIDNEIHLYCLHYVFQPRINRHLEDFRSGRDCHPLSTERNRSPNQLWIEGPMRSENPLIGQDVTLYVKAEIDSYGIDMEGPVPFTTGSRDLLEIPPIYCPLHDTESNDMNQFIDPLSHSDCFGIDIYIRCVSFAGGRLALSN
ncbi:uncharacterized protein LOC111343694 [Stylophora pistillata]|nr:uncharacterized protein LOC111343694 [Stylophora pistillata]